MYESCFLCHVRLAVIKVIVKTKRYEDKYFSDFNLLLFNWHFCHKKKVVVKLFDLTANIILKMALII